MIVCSIHGSLTRLQCRKFLPQIPFNASRGKALQIPDLTQNAFD